MTQHSPIQPVARVAVPSVEIMAFATDNQTVEALRDYLGAATTGETRVQKGRISDAIAALQQAPTPPRVLIVDISGAETPLSEIDRLAEVCEPSVVVIALGDVENVHLFRELIRAGVSDYVTKPLAPDLLEPYVRERRATIAASPSQVRRGRLVAVAGARGGVGATTLAVATAWRLANVHKRRVALLDLDLHGGGASVQLGVQPGGLQDALDNHARLDSLFLDRTLIACGARLSLMAEQAPLRRDVTVSPEAVERVIDALAEDFHYIVADLPRSFGAGCAHVYARARVRVMVVDRTLPALRDGARMLEIEAEKGGATVVVVNDHQPGLRKLVATPTIAKALGHAPDIEIDYDRSAPKRGDNLGEALGAGRGPLAAAAERLTAAVSNRRVGPGQTRRGLFGLLGGRR